MPRFWKRRKRHAQPHFNAEGGCVCGCRECVRVTMHEVGDRDVDIKQRCCCRRCNEQCPIDRRIVFARIAKR